MAPLSKADRLYMFGQKIAERSPEFFVPKGAGKGDHASNIFMTQLRPIATESFGWDHTEARLCGDTNLAIDFCFFDEEISIEVAFGLDKPNSQNSPGQAAKRFVSTHFGLKIAIEELVNPAFA